MAGSNFSLAFEVYRTPIWMMRPDLFLHYKGIMEMARMTQEYDTEWEDQKQHPSLLVYSKNNKSPEDRLITRTEISYLDSYYEFKPTDQVIHRVPISGPILHGDAPCTYGTLELADEFRYADEHPFVIGHLVVMDTPGGSCDANDLNEVFKNAKKPIVAIIRGMNCSKGVWISSFIPHVYAERSDVEIGCVGAMWNIMGRRNGEIKDTNLVFYQVYADNSAHKNGEYREAVQNDNLKPAIETLNRLDEEFRQVVKNRWPNVPDEKLTGKIYKASEVIGEMVDGIKSYAECVEMIFELAGVERISKGNITPLGTRDEPPIESGTYASQQIDNNPKNLTVMANIEALEKILGKGSVVLDEDGNPQLTAEQIRKLNEHAQTMINSGSLIANQQQALDASQEQVGSLQAQINELKNQLAEKDKTIAEMANETSPGIQQPAVALDNGAEAGKEKDPFPHICSAQKSHLENLEAMSAYYRNTNHF